LLYALPANLHMPLVIAAIVGGAARGAVRARRHECGNAVDDSVRQAYLGV
jgi:hypothetical protein